MLRTTCMCGNMAYAVNKPTWSAPIPKHVAVFRHSVRMAFENAIYGGETLTQALPPFLARSPTFLLASKFHTPKIPIVFQVRIILKPFYVQPSTRSFLIYFTPSSPHGVIKIIIYVIIFNFSQNYLMHLFFPASFVKHAPSRDSLFLEECLMNLDLSM